MENESVLGVVPSPFDYSRQMQAITLTDHALLPPEAVEKEKRPAQAVRRLQALAKSIRHIASHVPGGVLVLFTSVREMSATATALRAVGIPPDRELLVQGEAGRAELVSRFRSHENAILFGVASFWQGVDVPGDALRTVVIARLPFPSPEDPITEAECWLAGPNWWKGVYVPTTAIVLRQGVGRLIRTETDTGLVVCADPRAAGKHAWIFQSCVPVRKIHRKELA